MPKDNDIRKVLVIGSGPIVIGQAAEFDYSGTQACRALREEGVSVVLLNPNPATIMTDVNVADRVYLEPLTVQSVREIFELERPEGLIATMGGQAGLNLAEELYESGILERYNVRLLGTGIEAIRKGEDRELFKKTMVALGQPVPKSMTVRSLNSLKDVAEFIGFPCVIRPAFTLGGTGGGYARTIEELAECLKKGLSASPIHEVLVETSLYGQKEIEFEIVRDAAGNAVAVSSMENIDPIGIHTGDSIVVAPALTLRDSEYQMLRKAALDIADGLDIRGACNVQFALRPDGSEYAVIEVNPRVSRSSALASKATGYPIARVAAKIAIGFTLDEILNEVTGKTTACHEPVVDYVAVKIPRWPWDKFSGGQRNLGLQMKSTGEVMAIGRTFEEALGKAISSLDDRKTFAEADNPEPPIEIIMEKLKNPDHTRLAWIFTALRTGLNPDEIASATGIDRFFIERMFNIVTMEKELSRWKDAKAMALRYPGLLRQSKTMGLSDKKIGQILGASEDDIRKAREALGVKPTFKMVDTCAGEFEARTPYYYSTYEESGDVFPGRGRRTKRPPVVVLGGGPIRIGQGIEFDYCAVHAAWALEKEGFTSVIINNNPETVSTDFNTASRLYFEPLTFEHVKNVIDLEQPIGVLVSFGGQTAINLVEPLCRAGVKILGTSAEAIDITEDRGKFKRLLHDLGIPVIQGTTVYSRDEAAVATGIIGFPVIVRPSYVLGGRAMAVAYSREELEEYLEEAVQASDGHPILIEKYIPATEVEVDVVSDGTFIHIPAILEHVERSGVHSGDSIARVPAKGLSAVARDKIVEYTQSLCRALSIRGIANIQYIVDKDTVFCLEVNPRASRTVPFVTKVTGFPLIPVATGLSLGRTLKSYGVTSPLGPDPIVCAVKMPVFSWSKMLVDPTVGPEMKSTGEVMGMGRDMTEAMLKGFTAQGFVRNGPGKVLMTIADRDKPSAVEAARILNGAGWKIYATRGTARFLEAYGIPCDTVLKVSERGTGQDGLDIETLLSRRGVDIVINTFTKGGSEERDGFKIRTLAMQKNIQVITCPDTAIALAMAVTSRSNPGIICLQDVPCLDRVAGEVHKYRRTPIT
ncbi:MAG: carbamoyl-phosphate synthase large subunit [Candidatus Fermentithermobacillus carboniphilus]|uniref:Carbamoyl phosphate synthase large chain n=1 Tax=Candidatus Fermentithermobacillus carboniphilus TaxID=3085328 RepID=A0AAT9LGQ9_9FIRM|nr:MAG: carbamoyl-phosphate synthase large subunit [Candidatus Fermentithermobacillus carboniphilus]